MFVVTSYSIWTSLQSLYEAAADSERVVADLVHVDAKHVNENPKMKQREVASFIEAGYPVIESCEYDLKKRKPDIAIYCLPYSMFEKGYNADEMSKVVPRLVYIPYGPQLNTKWKELLRLRYKTAMLYLAWKVIYADESETSEAKEYVWGDGRNIVTLGTPRIDMVKSLKPESFPEYVSKIKRRARGRKIVLWNTHHSINAKDHSFSAWKEMGMELVDYISSHPAFFFLWRPHPYFDGALKQYMGAEGYRVFNETVKKIENLYIDNESSYLPSFSVGDIMLSDASTMAKEFLYTGKPVIVTVPKMDIISNIKPYRCLYIYSDVEDVVTCLENLLSGNDLLREAREEYLQTVMPKDNKTKGKEILDYLVKEYDREILE